MSNRYKRFLYLKYRICVEFWFYEEIRKKANCEIVPISYICQLKLAVSIENIKEALIRALIIK